MIARILLALLIALAVALAGCTADDPDEEDTEEETGDEQDGGGLYARAPAHEPASWASAVTETASDRPDRLTS